MPTKKKGTRLSEIIAAAVKPFEVTIKFEADEVAIAGTFDPSSYTPSLEDELGKYMDDEKPGNAVRVSAQRMIKTWDLLDDDDNPIPLTPDGLAAVPTKFLGALIKEIGALAGPPQTKSAQQGSFS